MHNRVKRRTEARPSLCRAVTREQLERKQETKTSSARTQQESPGLTVEKPLLKREQCHRRASAQRLTRRSLLAGRAESSLDVEPVASVLVFAQRATQAVNRLAVSRGGSSAGGLDHLLLVDIPESRFCGQRARQRTRRLAAHTCGTCELHRAHPVVCRLSTSAHLSTSRSCGLLRKLSIKFSIVQWICAGGALRC